MIQNVDDLGTKIERHVCDWHRESPGKTYAGCTCWTIYSGSKCFPSNRKVFDFQLEPKP